MILIFDGPHAGLSGQETLDYLTPIRLWNPGRGIGASKNRMLRRKPFDCGIDGHFINLRFSRGFPAFNRIFFMKCGEKILFKIVSKLMFVGAGGRIGPIWANGRF